MKLLSEKRINGLTKKLCIHFFSDIYSMNIYKSYNSIKELMHDMNIKNRNSFELYYS